MLKFIWKYLVPVLSLRKKTHQLKFLIALLYRVSVTKNNFRKAYGQKSCIVLAVDISVCNSYLKFLNFLFESRLL